MNRPLEQRSTRGTVEFRAPQDGAGMPGLRGYALKFKKRSQNLGGFYEEVGPAAVNKSLGDKLDVLVRQHHLDEYLVGRTGAGTAFLRKDDTGLIYEVPELPDTTVGRDLAVQLKRGDIAHSSFAFFTVEDDWSTVEDGTPLRTLVAIRLVDVAPVVTPAYLDTDVAVRSLASRLNVDPSEIPALRERNEIVARLRRPTVVDLGRRDATIDMLTGPEAALDGDATAGEVDPADVPVEPVPVPEPATEHPLNERQCAQKAATEALVEAFGAFDQSSGPNGAHYAAPSPFAADGLLCANCTFYEGSRACEVVAGDVDPGAVCKLWIIPADLAVRSEDDTATEQRATHSASVLRRRMALEERRPR